jgi:hypothetical protein
VIVYGTRSQTRSDHFVTVRDRAGFRGFDAAQRTRLEQWLISRAMEHERPKALHALACEQLRSIKVARPGVDALVRMIGAARDRAHAATFDALSDQFTAGRLGGLDRLLVLREAGGVTWLEWLRTPAADGSARPIVGQIEKLRELQALEADLVDLTMLPPGRVRILASEARRRSAWELSRLPPARRYPVLLVFIAEMIVERGDELIDLYCKAVLNAERHARQTVKDQREKTARARDERSHLAGTLARILLDAADGGEDPLAHAHCGRSASSAYAPLSRIPARWHGRSTSNAATRWATATPISRSSRPQSSQPWICARLAGTSRCWTRSTKSTRTGRCACCPTPGLRCSPLRGVRGRWMSTAGRCAPAMSSRCGCSPVTRCARAGCTGLAATATAIRWAG